MQNNFNLLVVIVLYNQLLSDSKSYKSIINNINELNNISILIYDNSFKRCIEYNFFIANGVKHTYEHNENNPGISVAYNFSHQFAVKHNFDWLLFLDQDTELPNNSLNVYLNSIAKFPNINLFAPIVKVKNGLIISPYREKFKVGYGLKSPIYGELDIRMYGLINSGIMVSTLAFSKAGGYNELVRLDFSDLQFLSRFRRCYKKFSCIDLCLLQDLSSFETDIEKLLIRFKYFCRDAYNFESSGILDRFAIIFIFLKHTLALSIKNKSFKFILNAYSYYYDL